VSVTTQLPLYGPEQSRFARYLERRELAKPDLLAREHRRGLLAGLKGQVLEVGCGDGRAFELYPPAVAHVVAVEPDSTARAVAAERAREAEVRIDVVDGTAEALPVEDGAFDAVAAVWVLCSVRNPAAALAEMHRVIRPGGELRFYEHVRSENAAFRWFQKTIDGLFWTRALGGCVTTRDTTAAMKAAGFEIVELERGFHSSSLLTITSAPYVIGTARR
jgi:ubiquinone/menaquinone biosynthesis C-methylase UbiE